MNIVKTFGHYVDLLSEEHPEAARFLLRTGWKVQNQRYRHLPDKRLMKADQYLADFMMQKMIEPLDDPEHSAIVSIFTPCELMQEAGVHPYNVESFSCYLSGSYAERNFVQEAENCGISETLCSYHKIFIGAAKKGLLPKPAFIVYTNLVCDANLLTFRELAEFYGVPSFFIDVPLRQTEANVEYVAGQLRRLKTFIEEQTGRTIDDGALRRRIERSDRTVRNYRRFQDERREHCVLTDLTTPMYAGLTANVMLGTQEEERYTEMLLRDVYNTPPAHGIRIYWMHTIPFWSDAVKEQLYFNENAQIVGEELQQGFTVDMDTSDPYRAMAQRMVYNALNGGISRRIENGIRNAKAAGADGAVWFAHWGCKHTLGAAQLAKKRFEEAGIPLLVLDGDAVDRSHGGEGQTATRLGAFLEMLQGQRNNVSPAAEEPGAAKDVPVRRSGRGASGGNVSRTGTYAEQGRAAS